MAVYVKEELLPSMHQQDWAQRDEGMGGGHHARSFGNYFVCHLPFFICLINLAEPKKKPTRSYIFPALINKGWGGWGGRKRRGEHSQDEGSPPPPPFCWVSVKNVGKSLGRKKM